MEEKVEAETEIVRNEIMDEILREMRKRKKTEIEDKK